MDNPRPSEKPQPSAWAIGLLLASSLFAVTAIALFSTSYSPL